MATSISTNAFAAASGSRQNPRRSLSANRSLAAVASDVDDSSFPQRFSSSGSSGSSSNQHTMSTEDQNKLLYAMEAEEEALVNSLSRKLEQLRAEKVVLESTLEMEQEQLVNRLQRQLSQLLTAQQQDVPPTASSLPSSPTVNDLPIDVSSSLGSRTRFTSSDGNATIPNFASLLSTSDPTNPPSSTILEALQTENNTLRNKLADAESSVDRASRMSEMYRLELLALRKDAGLDIADLMAVTPVLPSSQTQASSILSKNSSISSSSMPFSLSSSASTTSPSSSGRLTSATTPSVSYTTPQVPMSTPVSQSLVTSSTAAATASAMPLTSPVLSSNDASRAESLQRRLSNSRNGARIAETGVLRDRRSSNQ